MDNKVNYTLVGLFVIALGVIAVTISLWLTTMRQDEFTKTYVTYVRDDVSGLSVQGAVRFNGVKVGYVSAISLSSSDSQQVQIMMQIAADVPITTSTVATLIPQGITGIDYIGLTAKTPRAPLLRRKAGERYPVIKAQPSLLMRMTTVMQGITQSITKLTDDVNAIVDQQNRIALKNSLLNIEKITDSVSANAQEINDSLKAMNLLLQNSATASRQLPQLLENVNHSVDAVTDAATSIAASGKRVTETMQATASSVNAISQNLVPGAQSLLQRLNRLTETLQSVGNAVAENPAVIVRGKTPAPLGPGEK